MSRYGECACCGRLGELTGRGLVRPCHRRFREAGVLDEWPTEWELVEEDVAMVLATGASHRVTAVRCGTTPRQVLRILARWRLRVVDGDGPVPEVQGPVRAVRGEAA
ncbi:hypothetical protein KGD82_16780 [Nocardiopsis eucommiae]|uniref:Uncharacterized protein n=1 Tax=Nocardiopsis eucommiae TaxID=2831970 RepID=A0A975L5Y7_9ACTN|nr:hypothetical protein KGD82_16780 [Nocardiopsis eucommiae]